MNNKEGITKRKTKKKERTPAEESLYSLLSFSHSLPPSLSFLSPSQLSQRLSFPDDLLSKRWHDHTVTRPHLVEHFSSSLSLFLPFSLPSLFSLWSLHFFALHGFSPEGEEEAREVDRG